MLYTNFPRRRRTLHPCSPSFSHSFALFHTLSLSGFLLSDFWSAIKVLKSMFKCWTKRHNNSMAKTKVAPPIHPPPLRTFPANILGTRPSKRTHSAGPAGLFTFSAGHHFRCKIHNAHCAGILPSYHWHFRQHFVHLWCVPPVIDWGLHLIWVWLTYQTSFGQASLISVATPLTVVPRKVFPSHKCQHTRPTL